MDELMGLFIGFLTNFVTAVGSVQLVTGVTIIGIIFSAFLLQVVISRFVG